VPPALPLYGISWRAANFYSYDAAQLEDQSACPF
jgi:hypothetical protein